MGQDQRLSVSAISFLNTAPLMWDFDHGSLRQEYRVDYTLPSACAEMLRTGVADIGIIPVAAYASIPGLAVIPEIAIAARGPVRSILLISKLPLEKIRRIAVDTSSRTSVALLRVMFAKFHGSSPEFKPAPPKLGSMLKGHDAALIIGDSALVAETNGYYVFDLAAEWQRSTGKSFVFAFWAVRKTAILFHDSGKICSDFQRSRDAGLQPENTRAIAREWAVRLRLSEEEIATYLTQNIYYHLDSGCLEGLDLFFRYAAECGALPAAPPLQFLQRSAASTR